MKNEGNRAVGRTLVFDELTAAPDAEEAVAGGEVTEGLEELLLGVLGQLSEDGGGGIGERAAEAFDGLEGLVVVYDDGGVMLVGLLQRCESLEAAVGEQLGRRIVGGGRGDADVGLLVFPCLGEDGNGHKAEKDGEEPGARGRANDGGFWYFHCNRLFK